MQPKAHARGVRTSAGDRTSAPRASLAHFPDARAPGLTPISWTVDGFRSNHAEHDANAHGLATLKSPAGGDTRHTAHRGNAAPSGASAESLRLGLGGRRAARHRTPLAAKLASDLAHPERLEVLVVHPRHLRAQPPIATPPLRLGFTRLVNRPEGDRAHPREDRRAADVAGPVVVGEATKARWHRDGCPARDGPVQPAAGSSRCARIFRWKGRWCS